MKEKAKSFDKKSIIRIVITVLFLGLLVYCSFSLINNYADISRLKAQAADLDTQYEQQINENEKVKAILDSDNKDEYIEQKAREKGYAKDGEMVFYDISSSK